MFAGDSGIDQTRVETSVLDDRTRNGILVAFALFVVGVVVPFSASPTQVKAAPTLTRVAGIESVDGAKVDGTPLFVTEALEAGGGTLYVASFNEVYRVDGARYSLVAGGGRSQDDGIPATEASIAGIKSISVGPLGELVIVTGQRVRVVDPVTGTISTIANASAPASLSGAEGATFGPDGAVYVADFFSHRVLRVTLAGEVSIVAGTGSQGFSGDGGDATAATLNGPWDVAFSGDDMLIADRANGRIRSVSAGIISTFAGDGDLGSLPVKGAQATASIGVVSDLTVDGATVYALTDDCGFIFCSSGTIAAISAGTYSEVLNAPAGGNAESMGPSQTGLATVVGGGQAFRLADSTGTFELLAGSGYGGPAPDRDDVPALDTWFPELGLLVDGVDDLYMVAATAGTWRTSPTAGPNVFEITPAQPPGPLSGGQPVGVLPNGNLLINTFSRFVEASPTGRSALYGTGACGDSGDGGPAAAAAMCPNGASVAPDGTVTFVNTVGSFGAPTTSSIRRIDGSTGTISTIRSAFTSQPMESLEVTDSGDLYRYIATGLSDSTTLTIEPLGGTASSTTLPYDMIFDVEPGPNGEIWVAVWEGDLGGDPGDWSLLRLAPDGSTVTVPSPPNPSIKIGSNGTPFLSSVASTGSFPFGAIHRIDGLDPDRKSVV